MVIIGFTEFWPTDGTFEITLDYSLEQIGIREGYFDYNQEGQEPIYKNKESDDITLFPFIN